LCSVETREAVVAGARKRLTMENGNERRTKEGVMAAYTFRSINKNQLGWHADMGGNVLEWLYLDGWMDNDYKYTLVLASRMDMGENVVGPEKGDWPLVDCGITSPEGVTQRDTKAFPIEELKLETWGATIGDNVFTGSLTPDGLPSGYRVKVAVGRVGMDIDVEAICTGIRFVEEEHGYIYYDPTTNTGAAWWPLVPNGKVKGTLTFDGKKVPVTGFGYCERQLGNTKMLMADWVSHWAYGKFWAGDYMASWTYTAAPESMQYLPFSPLVLWKGSDIVLSTHNLSVSIDKMEFDPVIGMPFPTAETIHATEGNTELRALLLPGTIAERDLMVNNPGTSPEKPGCYFRQWCEVDIEIRRLDRKEHIRGKCLHEFGWISQVFPVPGRHPIPGK